MIASARIVREVDESCVAIAEGDLLLILARMTEPIRAGQAASDRQSTLRAAGATFAARALRRACYCRVRVLHPARSTSTCHQEGVMRAQGVNTCSSAGALREVTRRVYSTDRLRRQARTRHARSAARTVLRGNPRAHAARARRRICEARHRRAGRGRSRLRGREGVRDAAPARADRAGHAGALSRTDARRARARASARRSRRSRASSRRRGSPRSTRRRSQTDPRRATSTSR